MEVFCAPVVCFTFHFCLRTSPCHHSRSFGMECERRRWQLSSISILMAQQLLVFYYPNQMGIRLQLKLKSSLYPITIVDFKKSSMPLNQGKFLIWLSAYYFVCLLDSSLFFEPKADFNELVKYIVNVMFLVKIPWGLMKKQKDNWFLGSPLLMPIPSTLCQQLFLDTKRPRLEDISALLTPLPSTQLNCDIKYSLRRHRLQLSPLPISSLQVLQLSSSSSLARAIVKVSTQPILHSNLVLLPKLSFEKTHLLPFPLEESPVLQDKIQIP